MAVTRDQARRLLSESEMTLFSESRNPALRALSARDLARRVERTRKLRDKSRDLLQRQRLSSRKRTGNKGGTSGVANERTARKGEVLDDILQRFDSRLQDVQRADEAAASSDVGAGATGRKAGKAQPKARKATARKTADTTGPAKAPRRARKTRSAAPRATTSTKAAKASSGAQSRRAAPARAKTATEGAARSKATAATKKRPRKAAITPDKALAQTRELLEAKQQRDREPRAYQVLDVHAEAGPADPGYQSGTAKQKAQELHAGEIRLEPIHGSISTRDRQNQGKRDHRS